MFFVQFGFVFIMKYTLVLYDNLNTINTSQTKPAANNVSGVCLIACDSLLSTKYYHAPFINPHYQVQNIFYITTTCYIAF